jgi:hypothetical protein
VKPVLQALVLAEHVYEDKLSGKKIIAGTFNRLVMSKTPPIREVETPDGAKQTLVRSGGSGAPYAYISFTDVCDSTECELQFVSLTRNQVIFRNSVVIQCDDRLRTIEIIAPLPRLPIPEPGVYAFEIVCEGEVIGSHRIIAVDGDQPEVD